MTPNKRTIMTNEKKLREEFDEKFPLVLWFGSTYELDKINRQEVYDWFLSKLHSHTKEVVEKIKGMRKLYLTVDSQYDEEKGTNVAEVYNQALDDLLASLEDNKK